VLGLALELSGKRLQQLVVEVGTVFYLLGAATLPAFLLFTGVLLAVPWLIPSLRRILWSRIGALSGLLMLGFASEMGIWYGFSNTLIDNYPQAESFAYFLPISFFGAFILLYFCPQQPREKYQGLTISTINQPILNKNEGDISRKGMTLSL